jgi:hypothetical protein
MGKRSASNAVIASVICDDRKAHECEGATIRVLADFSFLAVSNIINILHQYPPIKANLFCAAICPYQKGRKKLGLRLLLFLKCWLKSADLPAIVAAMRAPPRGPAAGQEIGIRSIPRVLWSRTAILVLFVEMPRRRRAESQIDLCVQIPSSAVVRRPECVISGCRQG